MMIGLFCLIAAYGLCMAAVHMLPAFTSNSDRPKRHVVFITRNNEMEIEWALRSMMLTAWVRGQILQMTVLDHGSTDDTLHIVNGIARKFAGVLNVKRLHGEDPSTFIQAGDEVFPMGRLAYGATEEGGSG